MTRCFLGLGSNLGDREAELRRAIASLEIDGDLRKVSSLYETEPQGGPPQGLFLNLVVELDSSASPEELLARCQRLEAEAHRVRGLRNGPRSLDVDILWIDGVVLSRPELSVPHPRMYERRFVLAPLRELAPDLVTESQLAAAGGEVRRIGTL